MADQVDSMSDAELRTKLAEHGFPRLPVTFSTRKLLAKKLKMVLENKGNKPDTNANTSNRRSLARYSSGEDSDLDTSKVSKEKSVRNRRTTGSMPPPAPSTKVRRPTPKKDIPSKVVDRRESESDEEKSPLKTHEEVETITTRRITRTYNKSAEGQDYDTGSDSEIDSGKNATPPLRSNSRSSDYISSTLPSSSYRSSPPKSSFLSSRVSPTVPSYTSPSASAYGSSSSADALSAVRSRLGLTSSFLDRPSLSSNLHPAYSTEYKPTEEISSPYLSSFTRRLSSLKSDPISSYPDSETNNGSSPYIAKTVPKPTARIDVRGRRSITDKKAKYNLVSIGLIGILALFFILLSFMYMGMKSDISFIVEDKSNQIPVCKSSILGNRPGVNCIPADEVKKAFDLLTVIYPELVSRATNFKCGDHTVPAYMTDDNILTFATQQIVHPDINQISLDLHNLHVLIVYNPKWGISVIQTKNLYSQDYHKDALQSMDEVLRNRQKSHTALIILEPSVPLRCLLFKTVSTLFSLAAGLVVAGLVFWLAKYYMEYRKTRNEEVYSMVEQMIDVISSKGDSSVPVSYVRDIIIPPKNREKLASVWDAAVKYLERNESRVRAQVQTVDGEEFRAWQWLPAAGGQGSPRHNASWQGQAFETQEGSVNSLAVSPTPCLKIRHMVDRNDANPQLKTVIQDVILEKCNNQCKILHLEMDRASCCVYVKCASPQDAGVVYRGLHGWWYDGKLVTVKYLRLERYMERFPHSPSTGPYLRPSGQRHASSWDE